MINRLLSLSLNEAEKTQKADEAEINARNGLSRGRGRLELRTHVEKDPPFQTILLNYFDFKQTTYSSREVTGHKVYYQFSPAIFRLPTCHLQAAEVTNRHKATKFST